MSLDDVQQMYDDMKTKKAQITQLQTDKQTYITDNKAAYEAAIAEVSTHQTAMGDYDTQIQTLKEEIADLAGQISDIFRALKESLGVT